MSMAAEPDGLPQPRRTYAAICLAAGIAIAVLDASMVNIALPSAARALDLTPAEAVWVVNAFQITVVGMLIPFSSLGEILGFKRVWSFGLALFSLGALASALAPDFGWLLAARVMQGFGAAAVMSLLSGLIRNTYPTSQLGQAIGNNAMTVAICSAAGPSIGAAVLAVAPWPFVFAVHVPIGLAALVFGVRHLPDVPPQRRPFDILSAALNVAAFGLAFLGIDLLLHRPATGIALMAAGIFCAGLLLKREMSRSTPLLPLDLLRVPTIRFAVMASICMFAVHILIAINMPFHLSAAGFSPMVVGMIITPYPIAIGLLAPIAGRLSDRLPSAIPCAIGGGLLAVAMVLLSVLPAGRPELICPALLLAGIGFGFFQAPNNRAIVVNAPRARAGGAGGLQSTARVLGQAIGATTAAACFTLAGPWLAFLCGAVLAVLSALASLSRR
ncbi:MFS transporter [Roseococcus sp. YIM B11640]|uniref:MFS transporter n=1 Tax=Roseococcus sp. YIM B11640 TaxID=3133973 RepID=UPI003C7AD835